MLRIFIGTDSRGTFGHKKNWTSTLQETHPNWEFIMRRSGIDIPTYNIFDSHPFLLSYPKQYFDVAFIQSGHTETTELYTPAIFAQYFKHHFNQSAVHPPIFSVPDSTLSFYCDLQKEIDMFDILKEKCKYVVFISVHNLSNFGSRRLTRNYLVNSGIQNERWRSLATHTLKLPTTIDWSTEHCTPDGIHFNEKGHDYIRNLVEKWLLKKYPPLLFPQMWKP